MYTCVLRSWDAANFRLGPRGRRRTVPAFHVPSPTNFAAIARSTSNANPPRCSASLANSSRFFMSGELSDKRAALRIDTKLFQMRRHIFHSRLSVEGST